MVTYVRFLGRSTEYCHRIWILPSNLIASVRYVRLRTLTRRTPKTGATTTKHLKPPLSEMSVRTVHVNRGIVTDIIQNLCRPFHNLCAHLRFCVCMYIRTYVHLHVIKITRPLEKCLRERSTCLHIYYGRERERKREWVKSCTSMRNSMLAELPGIRITPKKET